MGLLDMFGSDKKTSTNFSSQTNPWAPTIPQLNEFLQHIQGFQSQGFGLSPEQQALYDKLKGQLAGGNPDAGAIQQLAQQLLQTQSRGGAVDQAYQKWSALNNPVASGENIKGFADNPYVAKMLQQNANDISSRINAEFAGAGRDFSGANQTAIAKGISEGTVPTLAGLYQNELARTDAARGAMVQGAATATGAETAADAAANMARLQGIPASQAGIEAATYGPNAILNLLQQQREIPLANAGQFLDLLRTVGGMGGQTSGASTSKSSGSGWGADLGGLARGVGTAFSLSDARTKEDVEEVGRLEDGTPIHKYTYKGDPKKTTYIGLLAQQVEKKNPGAVAEDASGTKYVNYDKATARSVGLLRRRRA